MDLSIDIETLSTKTDAVVLSIGICWFDPHTDFIGDKLHLALDGKSQPGRRIDVDTVMWWLQQSDAARAAFLVEDRKSVWEAWCALRAFIDNQGARVWANDPHFDIVILESLFADYPQELWGFRDPRSLRTIKDLAKQAGSIEFEPIADTAHNALDDAIYQARVVQKCIRHLGWGK